MIIFLYGFLIIFLISGVFLVNLLLCASVLEHVLSIDLEQFLD
jgi:hypothetical protein